MGKEDLQEQLGRLNEQQLAAAVEFAKNQSSASQEVSGLREAKQTVIGEQDATPITPSLTPDATSQPATQIVTETVVAPEILNSDKSAAAEIYKKRLEDFMKDPRAAVDEFMNMQSKE